MALSNTRQLAKGIVSLAATPPYRPKEGQTCPTEDIRALNRDKPLNQ